MLIGEIFGAFRQGKELANAAAWKNRAIAGNALAAFASSCLAIASAFGYQLDIDRGTLEAVAGGVAALVCLLNGGVHITTSERVGLPPKSEAGGSDSADGA